jgi:hypothetical protein
MDSCAHALESQLATPQAWLRHTGPLKPLGEIDDPGNELKINVVAVSGEQRLRAYTLAFHPFDVLSNSHYEPLPMVLRGLGCLAYCLEVCHKANCQVIGC